MEEQFKEMDKLKVENNINNSAFDDISTITITGISKFNMEVKSTDKLVGDKFFIKNHTKNHYGEEEPNDEEEIIARHKF